MKIWKGKMVRWKNPEPGQENLVGIVLNNPKEDTIQFTPKAIALILVVDVMWGDTIQQLVPIDELIICKSTLH
jgi:hypothetical protein